MSQVPPQYNRQYSFYGFSVNNPESQQPGNELDQEFDTIRASLNQTISRLSEIQRDDGQLKMSDSQAAALADESEGTLAAAAQAAVQAAAGGSHTHTISQVTGLQASLNQKADEASLISGLAGKASSSHTHPISDVTNLQASLDGKASSTHVHQISDVTGLSAEIKGRLLQVSILTGSGTFIPPAGAKSMYVEVQGGGGGGPGVGSVVYGGVICSSGGGGGGFSAKYYSTLGASYTYSVGAASAAGGAGNLSTFDVMTANGGSAGAVSTTFGSYINATGGNGGSATGGDLNINGQKGGSMMMANSFVTFSNGGNSHMGLGGIAVINSVASPATGFGGGGGGVTSYGYPVAQTSKAGSVGGAGIIRVWVYG